MKRSFSIEATSFVLHFILATVGAVFAGFGVVFLVSFLREKTGISLDSGLSSFGTAYSPWFWIPAGLGGFFVNRAMRNRSACLVGVVTALLLCTIMSWDVTSHRRNPYYSHLINEQYRGRYWHYEIEQLLSPSDAKCGSSECLGKLIFTVPAVTSIAYSIGAWVGLRSKRKNMEQANVA